MFRKLTAVLLAFALMLPGAAFGLEADCKDYAREAYEAYGPEGYEAAGGMSMVSLATGGMWSPSGRTFDDPVDQAFFNRFGVGFEFLRDGGVPLNREITYGNWIMEVISAFAVQGETLSVPGFHQLWERFGSDFERDEDTGIWTDGVHEFDENTGIWTYDGVEIETETEYFDAIEIYTLFSIRDASGTVDLSLPMELGISIPDFDGDAGIFGGIHGWASMVNYDEETGTAFFMAQHRVHEPGGETSDVKSLTFTIDRILAEPETISEEIMADLMCLPEGHEAAFTTADRIGFNSFGGSLNHELMYEVFGEGFDPFLPDTEIMMPGELDIPIMEGFLYLSNVALRDNILFIQTRQPEQEQVWPQRTWISWQLADGRVEMPDMEALFQQVDWDDPASVGAFNEAMMTAHERFIYPVYSINMNRLDEDFRMSGESYIDNVFYIEDLDMLPYLSLYVRGATYTVVESVNLVVPVFEVPVMGSFAAVDERVQINIYGQTYTIRNITADPLSIRFTIENAGRLIEMMEVRDGEEFFWLLDHIEVEGVLTDGAVVENSGIGAGSFVSWGEDELGVGIGVAFAGFGELEALRINGALIELE